jgi:hypothetical protein
MKFGRIVMVVVDVVFIAIEALSGLARRRAKPKDLTAAELLERKDADLRRRTTAKTVVIPPPSERERPKRR